ncbi:MAG: PBSX family phage terminase large subunit [Ruminococcaceae bacterium]|nr:PBSX family phage terminase large subunit [Oscillospiraceae bacterium]
MTSSIKLSEIVGGGYDDFWGCKARYRVLKGGKGSKKSATTALNFIFRIMRYPDSNLLVVRQVMNTHRDSTFAQLKWAQSRLGVSHLWSNTVSPLEMTYLPTGQKILFRGFDDVLKLASTTVNKGYLNFVWVEEAFELAHEEDFDKLDLSMPRGSVPSPLFKQTTLTFNPWSAAHWLKKRFFDRESSDIKVFSTNYLINEFLDDTDRAVFERMKRTNRRKYEVAGLGNWGIAEGLVFENWEVGAPQIPPEKLNCWRSFFGLDYGYTNDPTAFVAFMVNPVEKILYIYDEFYKTRMLNCDIANEIKKRGYSKERIRADCAEPKSNDDLKRLGIGRITPSVKGRDSILNGIDRISEYKIFVDDKCVNMIRELSTYCYEESAGESGRRMPKDSDNHLCDALRYAFEDVRFFHPEKHMETPYTAFEGLRKNDFSGGWS